MRFLISALLTTLPVFGCSCLNTASPCTAMGEGTVVFVARVVVDSGDGWGKGPARVVVEEPIWNVSKDLREAEINTAAGTSCYYHLEAGERYVIIAVKPQSRCRFVLAVAVAQRAYFVCPCELYSNGKLRDWETTFIPEAK